MVAMISRLDQGLGYMSAAKIKGNSYPRGITLAELQEALLLKDYFPVRQFNTTNCCKFKPI